MKKFSNALIKFLLCSCDRKSVHVRAFVWMHSYALVVGNKRGCLSVKCVVGMEPGLNEQTICVCVILVNCDVFMSQSVYPAGLEVY